MGPAANGLGVAAAGAAAASWLNGEAIAAEEGVAVADEELLANGLGILAGRETSSVG